MVSWNNLCRSPATARLNPALQQYYAEETEEFYTNLANGLDNLVVTLGVDNVRVEWLELAVSFLRSTHSEVQVLVDKLIHYASPSTKPEWMDAYMEESGRLLAVCEKLKPGIERIERYEMCVELASRALSNLDLDAIQADLMRCLTRGAASSRSMKMTPEEDPPLRRRAPPSRESFEFPVTATSPMDTSPVMPSSPLRVLDVCQKADKLIQSIESMNLGSSAHSSGRHGGVAEGALARDAVSLRSQFIALDQHNGGDEQLEHWQYGMEDLESLVAEAEKLLYMRRPGSLTEPPSPPPGLFDGPVPVLPRPSDTGSPLRPFKMDSNFKIDISPSKSSDSSSSPHSSRRRSSELRPGSRKPPIYPHSDRLTADTNSDAEVTSNRHNSRNLLSEADPTSSRHSRQASGDSVCSVATTFEQISAPIISQFEASLTALRECKEEISREWTSSRRMETQKLIADAGISSRTGMSASFNKYFRSRPSMESGRMSGSRRRSSTEGSKLAQFLETLTSENEEDEVAGRGVRRTSSDLSDAHLRSEKPMQAMSPITEWEDGAATDAFAMRGSVAGVSSSGDVAVHDEPSVQAEVSEKRDLPKVGPENTHQSLNGLAGQGSQRYPSRSAPYVPSSGEQVAQGSSEQSEVPEKRNSRRAGPYRILHAGKGPRPDSPSLLVQGASAVLDSGELVAHEKPAQANLPEQGDSTRGNRADRTSQAVKGTGPDSPRHTVPALKVPTGGELVGHEPPQAQAEVPAEKKDSPMNRTQQVGKGSDSPRQNVKGLFYMGNPEWKDSVEPPSNAEQQQRGTSRSKKGQDPKSSPRRRISQSLDEIAIERLHAEMDPFLFRAARGEDTESSTSSQAPFTLDEDTARFGREEQGYTSVTSSKGSGGRMHRRSGSLDAATRATGKGTWQNDRTEAILTAYLTRRKAESRLLSLNSEITEESRSSSEGASPSGRDTRMTVKVEMVDESESASLSEKFPEEVTDFRRSSRRLITGESRALEQASVPMNARVGDMNREPLTDLRSKSSDAFSVGRAAHLSTDDSTNAAINAREEPARHRRPSGRVEPQNVSNVVAKFESFFDAEFDAKHDIKGTEKQAPRNWSADFAPKVKVYENPLHRPAPDGIFPAPLMGRRKSRDIRRSMAPPSPSRFWRIESPRFWRRSTSPGHLRGRSMQTSPAGRQRHSSASSTSPHRLSLNLFSHVKHWIGHHGDHDHDDEDVRDGTEPENLRRSKSARNSKASPHHRYAVVKSPGRLSLNLFTLQKGATSFVRNFGSAAMKQCAHPTGGSSRWTGLGGVFLATKASTGVVSSFLLWILARSDADVHPSLLHADVEYTIRKIENHWSSSLSKLQERVSRFDVDQRQTVPHRREADAGGFEPSRQSHSSEDRKGKKRFSLDLKPRPWKSTDHGEHGNPRRSFKLERPESMDHHSTEAAEGSEKSSKSRISPCFHIRELKEVHKCVEELHVGLEFLFSACLSALGKNSAALEELPQEKIIRECIPSESPSNLSSRRKLFDTEQKDGDVHRDGTSSPIPPLEAKDRKMSVDGAKGPTYSELKSHRRKTTEGRSQPISYAGSSFSFELDNVNKEQVKAVEAIFEDWRSGKMAGTVSRLHQNMEEFRSSLKTVSREVDDLCAELESGRKTLAE